MKKLTVTMMAAQAALLAFPLAAHADVASLTATVDQAPHAAVHLTVDPPVALPLPDARTIPGSLPHQVTQQLITPLPIHPPVFPLGR
jgi:hypothetical protein